ncbi:T9SS type A sorting domain-containing protein [Hymenobacter sp. 15J16-1T3B]|uniref:Ig-like domain-containing protein n=1 Tax=Hymenobacter sp. 15J16-1T3B TaxID=2886941 RepID=UPI001D115CF0|nr:T9SS type A sorting domain-containing protein [Hymenobacter sp. 15J16-1T3B]MCC3159929.1 T9SS type A sorting domain-containing protein [Hymenobacter sp. 15J16-1T3B]
MAALLLTLLGSSSAWAQLTGTKAIPGDYASLSAAITDLNTAGVGAGGVTFNVAAGYTETAANLTITATGTAANPIVFQKSGTGANPLLTAGVGTSTSLDGVIRLSGADYVTFDGIDVAENAANTTATTQMEFGYALMRASATDGSQNNIIRNCVVTLNKTNTATIGIAGVSFTTASSTAVAATSPAGANSNNLVYGNVVSNAAKGIDFSASSSSTTGNYDTNNQVGLTPAGAAAGNTIGNFGSLTTSAWGIGANYQTGFKASDNTVNSTLNYTSATASTPVAASTVTATIRGIYANAGSAATSIDITNNTITLASGATTSQMSGIENGIGSSTATVNITGNTVTNCTYATATAATFYGIYNSAAAGTVTISGNTVSNNTVPGTSSFYMISGGSPATLNITNNQLTGNTKGGSTASTSGTMYGIQALTAAVTVTGNTINNNTIASSGTSSASLYGYTDTSSPTSEVVTGNTITNLSITGTTTSTSSVVYGIYSNPIATTTKTYAQNVIGGLSSSVAGTVYGIYTLTGATVGVSRNKIYGLTVSGTGGTAYGLYISSGTTVTASNNLIGDVTAPAATGTAALGGVYVGGATTVNLYYNTVYLNAASTSTTTFGSSGIYVASTTPVVDLRNNVVVNNSTPGATGATAALRYTSAPGSSLASTTNNNLYYAGTPAANRVIYVEGTTTLANAQQTLAAYKTYIGSREQQSVTENPPFVSTTGTATTFLHISPNTATQIESGGTPISGITVDFDGDTRNTTTPDLGADEGTFTPQDLSGPSITFTPLGNTPSTTNRTLVVTIVDPSGVATGTNAPRLYFRKGTTGAFVFVNATTVSGNSYTFTFDYSLVGGVTGFDPVQYYVAAQDVPGNVSTNPAGGSGATPPGTTTPNTVYQFLIQGALSGTYYVGTGTSPDPTRTYATLTAAFTAYNNNTLGGAVTFALLDASYSTGETFPLVLGNNADASATNTLTIKPNTGVTSTITSTTSVLALSNARYIIIDGSNTAGGTTRDLTLTTTGTATGTYNVGLISTATTGPGNQNITVRNLNTVGALNTNTSFGIYVGNGPDNDNVTIQNNYVRGVYYGIYTFGSAVVSAGGMDNLVIADNVVGPVTAATASNIGQWGIYVSNAVSPSVTRNEVQNVISASSTNVYAIYVADSRSAVVSRNSVHNISYTGTSTTKVWAINTLMTNLSTAANPSALRLDNNLVYNINSTATSSTWNTAGINLNAGYGDKVYFNTVYLSGQLSAASGTAGSAAFSNGNPSVTSTSTNLDVRNNIFSIIDATGGTTTTPFYAHYEQGANVTGSTLDNNDLFVAPGATGAARIGRLNGTDYATLADWRTATGQEANSVSVNPDFAQTTTVPYDLKPTAVALNSAGSTTTGITVDYTGTTRGTTPDIGAYEFTPATIDVATTALASPATAGCYGATETVSVTISNNATNALNFAVNPATVTVTVTKPDATTQTFTTTVNTGTLAAAATQTVTLPGTLNMTAAGTYSFAVLTTTVGDANTGNNDLTATRTVTATAVQGQVVTFTGFTGSNLSTVFPGWTEATGATVPTGTTAAWTSGTIPTGNTTAKINLYDLGKNDWIVSPKFLATSSTVLTFDAGLSDYNSSSADPAGMTGTDDFAEVRISTDCGLTFTRIPGFAQFNAANQPSNGSLTSYSINLGAYAGQQIIVAFFASEGTVNDTPDYDFHVDNVRVNSPVAIDLAATALAAPTATQGCYSTAEAVTVTVRNEGTQALDFAVNPATVTAVVTTPAGSQTLTGTVSTGTLAVGATQNVTLTGTLDMSAAGTYSFALTATVTGDLNTSNDALTPAVTRTVAAPVAGTATASRRNVCVSGTTTLTLAGAANGSVQWQQSTDNTTFTDISGATSASFTTPVLTATTYYRAQVRCSAQTAATSNVLTITVTNPTVTTTNTPVAVCSGNTATLTATAPTGTSLRFFDAATGGTALATGSSFTTPALTASRQYFVEAFAGVNETTGRPAPTSTSNTTASNYGLVFDATSDFTLTSVDVYPTSTAGSMVVQVQDNTGTLIPGLTATVAVPAGNSTTPVAFTVPLNFNIPAGTGMRLIAVSSPSLVRESAVGGFPYTSPSGLVSITNGYISGTSTTYYFFYNWRVTSECASATRTAIQVDVNTPATATFSYPATGSNCAGATGSIAATLGTGATAGTFSSTTGLTLNATTGAINLATSTAGTYTVTNTVAAAGGCGPVTATATVTINPTPAQPTVTVRYAAPGTAVLTASAAPTGGSYQWYLGTTAITGATSQTYTANGTTSPGAYTVVVTSAQGCASPASAALTVTANSKPLAGSSLTLFPNPTPNGQLTLQLSGYTKAVELTVLDATGRVVYTHKVAAGQTQQVIDLSQVARGVYLLRAVTEGGTDTRRIVRE